MIFVLDENLPPSIARALHQVVSARGRGHRVEAVRDLLGPGVPDVDVFDMLSRQKPERSVIVTLDRYRKQVEQLALLNSDLLVFSLSKSWAHHPLWTKFHGLVGYWPTIESTAESAAPGHQVFDVPFGLMGRGRLRAVVPNRR